MCFSKDLIGPKEKPNSTQNKFETAMTKFIPDLIDDLQLTVNFSDEQQFLMNTSFDNEY